jgi:phosphate transport system permease protein
MATETETTTDGFGRISRFRGVLFRYATFFASVFGIVSLGVLLGFVFWDAFGMASAEAAWYGAFVVLVVTPVVGFLVWARNHDTATAVALELTTTIVGGVLGGFALVAVLELIAKPDVWFAYFVSLVFPVSALLLYGRYSREVEWTGLAALIAALGGAVLGTLLLGQLQVLEAVLGGPGVYFISLTVPSAAVLYVLVDRHPDLSRPDVAGALLLLTGLAGFVVADGLPLVDRSTWLLFLTGFGVPVGYAVTKTLADRDRWAGFLGPGGFIAGVIVLLLATEVLGLSGPSPWFDWQFITSAPSQTAAEAGLYSAVIGSVFIIVLVALFTLFLGVGAALYLEEYARSSGIAGSVARLIRINISNLAGVPSVVYGLLGLAVFGRLLGTGLGTVMTAALTLSLLILPIVIISAREAIASVPDSMRQASYGMGATRWQTVRRVVLPRALPGVFTGTILALGRAIGETAPLIMIGIATTRFDPPAGLFGKTTAMPMQIFTWASYPTREFQYGVVAAGVVTLLVVLLTMNSIAILLRNKYEEDK